jgi:hypothetical protein
MTEYYQYKKESIYKYYNANKDKIRAREIQKVKCDICNCEVQKKHLVKHNRLPKHIKNLDKLSTNDAVANVCIY